MQLKFFPLSLSLVSLLLLVEQGKQAVVEDVMTNDED